MNILTDAVVFVAVVAAAVAVESVALVDETYTFRIGAPKLMVLEVSFVVSVF